MPKKVYLEFFLVVSFVTLTWFGFSYLSCDTKSNFSLISKEQEKKIGNIVLQEILKNNSEVKNKYIKRAIRIIEKRLFSVIKKPKYEYNILVVESKEINAVTLPGGNIVIFSGLINFSENINEVVAVLAHEIGHAEKEHVKSRIGKVLGLELISVILSGGFDQGLLTEIMKLLISNSFDRKQEEESDSFALDLMTKTSINPRGLASFFRRMKEKNKDGFDLTLLSTHPSDEERIKKTLLYKLPKDFKEKKIPVNFQYMKRIVKKYSN